MSKREKEAQPFKAGQRFNPYGHFRGIYIPDCVAKTKLLTPVEKLVWGRLCKHAGEDGNCYPSFTRISEALGISRSGAIKSVASLVFKRFLEKSTNEGALPNGRHHRTNRYVFLWHECLNDGLKATSLHSTSEIKKQSASSIVSEPGPVYPVDQCGPQSRPKEILEKGLKKNTTTPSAGGSPSIVVGGGFDFALSNEEVRYIELKVDYVKSHGRLRKENSLPLENYLRLEASKGKLDMSDFERLKEWKSKQIKSLTAKGPLIVQDFETRHADLEAINLEVRNWWNSLGPTHPAKNDKRTNLYGADPDGLHWIRCQFQKYSTKEGPDSAE
ncbi:helix-turn-helix domain-containing protein [Pseudodesulfovibrio indicus]|uniref:Helix-turn-helix protein n=1 Tax=Pseudodesulfovibrio indicus TaxID=1716143 RepID=A0AA94PTJ1_9BACT|nr:helix-turn-helix domain-containing protein [Pseudodesulfovibrio indicus]TDT88636.1 helix-turn-helix protein [Pseudodesulfovibrio indicus]